TPYVTADKFDLAPFGKLAKDPDMCRNGKQWCLPILTTLATPIFYNIDLFNAAGVPLPPTDPTDKSWNLDKISDLAAKLTKNPGTADAVYGFATPNQFHQWAYLWGVDPWLKEWYEHGIAQKSNYLDPKVAQAQQYRADLINKRKVSPRPSDEQGLAQLGDIFKTGRVAMYWAGGNGYWLYSDITAFKWGVAPGPWQTTNKTVNFTDPVLISGDSKVADHAWSFIKYLTGKDGQTDYVKAIGTPPVRSDVFDTWLDYEITKTGMKSKDDLKRAALYYENDYIDNWAHYTVNAGQLQTIQTQDGQPIWDGAVAAKDQMAKIQKDMDDALAKTYDEYKSTRLTTDTLCQPIVASAAGSATCQFETV
ncbi:MAG TPA: extracellular solute-binding protein, partial [Chloroflexota bacterium]|nr:extracellular solute-binding protein [Chloroflexota bacterium]